MVMSDTTTARVAERIAEHAQKHGLGTVHVILHGGEPLLAGPARLERISRCLAQALTGVARLDVRVHTNGVRLDEAWLPTFEAANIKVGISLDGDRSANDLHRRFANGRSSYDQVVAAITLLRRHRHLFAGLLCTVDPRNDPIRVYEALVAFEPPRIDFLLPHATWDHPPLRPTQTAYADWLIAIHDRWVRDGRPVAIRLFDAISGRGGQTESLGGAADDVVVIETDGSYELPDSLKTAYEGAAATGMDVFRHALDEVPRPPDTLAEQCRVCPLVTSCGGGLYAHRYKTGSGFTNPSVYCADLFALIPHVQRASRPPHTFPVAALTALARAEDGPDEAALLHTPQLSLTRRLVATRAEKDEAWELLTRLDREHRDAVDKVLGYPYTRSWAASAAHLAAAIAIHARVRANVTVPIIDGMVYLPTLGRMRVGDGTHARVKTTGRTFAVYVNGRRHAKNGASWEPVRQLRAGGITVLLDDVDPCRDRYGEPVRDRLPDDELERWRKVFNEAWKLLQSRHRKHADAVKAGLRVVTPLSGAPGRVATSRQAHGAIALSECVDPETLAMLLVRGVRQGQLEALLDLFDLTGRDPEATRMMREAYDGLTVAEFMGANRLRGVLERAQRLLAGPLPDIGRRFVTEMSEAASARLATAERGG